MTTEKYPPRDGDLGYQEASLLLYPEVVNGAQVFIKWTCEACGERVTADEPMALAQTGQLIWQSGYRHTTKDGGSPCGHVVSTFTYRFGCMLVYSSHQQPTDWASVAKGN